MDWFLAHLLDIILVIVVIAITSYGHSKGFIRMIISIVGFAVAAAAAAFISNVTYEYVYFEFVQPAVISVIETEADSIVEQYSPADALKELLNEQDTALNVDDTYNTDIFADEASLTENGTYLTEEEFRVKINNVFTEYCMKLTDSLTGVLPDEIIESAEKYLEENSLSNEEKINFFSENNTSVAELIESEIVRPVMLNTVKKIIFAVSFFAVEIIFSIIARAAGILRKISEIRTADSFFGTLLGLVYSLLSVAAMSFICSIFIKLTGNDNMLVNTDIISGTYIFKYAYAGTFEVLSVLLK